MSRPSILISIPVPPNGDIFGETTRWIVRMTHHPRFDIGYDKPEGKPIDHVRNLATKSFLHSRYEYMLCVDSDVVPPDNAIDLLYTSLLSQGCDAMGSVVYSFQYEEPFAVVMDKDERGGYRQSPLLGRQRYIPCDAVGGACVLLKRSAVEQVGFQWRTQYNEEGQISWGQDFWFFEQLSNHHKLKLIVDSAIICSHYVKLDLKHVAKLIIEAEERGAKRVLEQLREKDAISS